MRICSMRASRCPLRAETEFRCTSSAAAWRARAACCRARPSYTPRARRANASSAAVAPGSCVAGAPSSSYSAGSLRMVASSCFSSRLSAFSLSACCTCLRAGREGAEAGRPGRMRGAALALAFAAALFAARTPERLALPAA